jgi:hypothetical protein
MFFNGVLTETVAELLNNELRVREKTRREAERVTNLGKDPAGSRSTGPSWSQGVGRWPLRGNQEAPSQPGGHARCASRNTAFVRAPWVGPPNRASPMRAFVIVLETLRGSWRCRSSRPKQGVAGACVRRRSQSVLCGEARMLWAAAKLVSWVVVPIVALPTLRRAATPQLHPSPVAVRRFQIGGPTLDM